MASNLKQADWSKNLPGGKPVAAKASRAPGKNGENKGGDKPSDTIAVTPTTEVVQPEPLPELTIESLRETMHQFQGVDFERAIKHLEKGLRGRPPSTKTTTRPLNFHFQANYQSLMALIAFMKLFPRI